MFEEGSRKKEDRATSRRGAVKSMGTGEPVIKSGEGKTGEKKSKCTRGGEEVERGLPIRLLSNSMKNY